MNTINNLKFWCYKILPLVYDDSLSYYEVLCKTRQKLNEIIDNVNELPEYINKKIAEQIKSDDLFETLFSMIIKAIVTQVDDNEFTNTEKFGGEIFWHDGKLVECIKHMDIGTNYVINTNIKSVNITEMLNNVREYISTKTEKYNERADRNIEAGEYLFWKDKFLKAKNDIPNDTILTDNLFENVCIGDELKLETDTRVADIARLDLKVDNFSTEINNKVDGSTTALNKKLDDSTTALNKKLDDSTTALNKKLDDSTANITHELNNFAINFNKKLNYVTPEDYGAVGDGVTDDTNAINEAINTGKNIKFNNTYLVTSKIAPKSNTTWDGNGTIIAGDSFDSTKSVIEVVGSNTESDVVHDVDINNITVVGGLFCIRVCKEIDIAYEHEPYNFNINNVKTMNSNAGSYYFMKAKNIRVNNCYGEGGNRFLAFGCNINDFTDINCSVTNCTSLHTKQFGIQTFFGSNIIINNNFIDATETNGGSDQSGITIDRSNGVNCTGNYVIGGVTMSAYITGAKNVNFTGNVILPTAYGIQVSPNYEMGETPEITYGENINVAGNYVKGGSPYSLTIQSQHNVQAVGNKVDSIFINDTSLSNNLVSSKNILVAGNCGTGKLIVASNFNKTELLAYGNMLDVQGIDANIKPFFGKRNTPCHFPAGNFELYKAQLVNELTLFEFQKTNDHAGFYNRYEYGTWAFKSTAGFNALTINMDNGRVKPRELIITGSDKNDYKIIVDSNGALKATRI